MNREAVNFPVNARFVGIILFFFLSPSLSFGAEEVLSLRNGPLKNISDTHLKKSYEEWGKFKKKELSPGFQVKWLIKVTQVSFFGGFYVRGYIPKNNTCKVHLIWDPNDQNLGGIKQKVKKGEVFRVEGSLEGFPKAGKLSCELKILQM